MLHEPAAVSSELDTATDYKMRTGVRLFLFYAVVYAGFVIVNVVNPAAMESAVLLGLNLAVIYGMGLILLAFVLAAVYTLLCATKERAC